MKLKDFTKKLLQDKKFKEGYYRKDDIAFDVGQMIIEARILKGLTQKELAKKVKTQQPSIARIESGSMLPSLTFLNKIAKALGTYLVAPKLGFMEEMGYQFHPYAKDTEQENILEKLPINNRQPEKFIYTQAVRSSALTQENIYEHSFMV